MLTEEQANTIADTLEDVGFTHEEIDAYLEHYGVKGMKWGTRQQTRLNASKRVAAGKARDGDKAIVLGKQSTISIIRSGGNIKKMAARDAMKLEASKERIKSGEATVRDLIIKSGAFTMGANH